GAAHDGFGREQLDEQVAEAQDELLRLAQRLAGLFADGRKEPAHERPQVVERSRGAGGRRRGERGRIGRGPVERTAGARRAARDEPRDVQPVDLVRALEDAVDTGVAVRSEEHTSELQSRENLVCRLLLEKKNRKNTS